MSDYSFSYNLKHNERPLKMDDQGLITEIPVFVNKNNKVPRDKTMMPFPKELGPWGRLQTRAWDLLETQTTDVEFKAAFKMARLAKAYTNSLEPLNPETTMLHLAEQLSIDRRKINSIIEKLFKLGVIGKFEVYDSNEIHHKYWIFNPYLHFNGKTIKRDVYTLFDKTFYARLDYPGK